MHELSIALSILDVAGEEVERHGATGLVGIHLKLGPLAGVVKEALLSAFDLARESSAWPEAQLQIEEVPIVAYCPHCQTQRAVESPQRLCCADCGTVTGELISGQELDIVALEIQ